jgi:hypothetical protein
MLTVRVTVLRLVLYRVIADPSGMSGSMPALENAMDYAPCDRPVRVRAASEFAGPRPQHPWTTSTSSSSLHFIQIGSHLGAFPLMAATYGCRVLAVEAYAEHTRYIDATGCVNGMSNLRVVHRAIDSVSDRELWFDEYYAQIMDDTNPRKQESM